MSASLAVCSVGYLLALNLLLPPSVRAGLVARYPDPSLVTLFTSSYVHANGYDLTGNLLVYSSVVFLCLAVYSTLDVERNWFRLAFLAIFFVLPVFISVTNGVVFAVLYEPRAFVSYGFSGITAGFIGFLYVLTLVFLVQNHSRALAAYVGIFVGLVVLGELLFLYPRFRRPWTLLVFLGVSAATLFGIGAYASRALSARTDADRGRLLTRSVSVVVPVAGVLLLVSSLLLPVAGSDGGVNVYAHLGGFVGGTLLSVLALRATRS